MKGHTASKWTLKDIPGTRGSGSARDSLSLCPKPTSLFLKYNEAHAGRVTSAWGSINLICLIWKYKGFWVLWQPKDPEDWGIRQRWCHSHHLPRYLSSRLCPAQGLLTRVTNIWACDWWVSPWMEWRVYFLGRVPFGVGLDTSWDRRQGENE